MKRSVLVASFFLFFSLTFPVSVNASTYYVAPTGSDGNTSIQAQNIATPWRTIQYAINTISAGNTIQVRSGIYSSFAVSKNNLIISGYSGERPLISGGSGVNLSGSGITLSNFEVTAMSANQSGAVLSTGDNNIIRNNIIRDNIAGGTNGILIMGANNQVLDNVVYNNNKLGIGIYSSTAINNVISRNISHGNILSEGDSDGIHCSGDSKLNTISNNETYGNSDDGIDMWSCTENQVLNNTSHHNGGTGDGHGIKLGYGGKNTAKGNISYSNLACGFTSNGGGNYYENNTAYSNSQCGFTDSFRVSGNTDPSSLIKNIAYSNPTNYVTGPYTTVFTGNLETPPTFNIADMEPDGDVDLFDFSNVVSHFGQTGSVGWIRADIIKNGRVDIFDFNKVIENFGQ